MSIAMQMAAAPRSAAWVFTVGTVFAGLLIAAGAAYPQTVQSDWDKLSAENAALSGAFGRAKAAVNGGETALRDASQGLSACKAKVRAALSPTLDRLREGRIALGEVRKGAETAQAGLEATRRELEAKRQAVEAAYIGRVRNAAYREQIAAEYVTPMRQSYVAAFQERVVAPLDHYGAGLKAYADVADQVVAFCKSPGASPLSAEAFATQIRPAVDAFLKSVKRSPAGSAAS